MTPGIRYEQVDGDWKDYASDATNTQTNGATGEIDAVAPGIGMTYALSDSTNAFGGIYKGISTPSPRGFLKVEQESRKALAMNLELEHKMVVLQLRLLPS